MRWWDGSAWTSDTYERTEPWGDLSGTPAAGRATGAAGAGPGPSAGGSGTGAGPVTRVRPSNRTGAVAGQATTTDDGVPLAGWWWRVLARVIDGVLVGVVAALVTYPSTSTLAGYLVDQASGVQPSVFLQPTPAQMHALYLVTVAQVAIGVIYEIGFLLWRAATPGKLLIGLRVRRWDPSRRLDLTAVAKRVLVSDIATSIPQVGVFISVMDGLWPLRDPRRQALHDKLAGTCVVRPRR
jgi:uncharacterized RDD family membrane protein YckC